MDQTPLIFTIAKLRLVDLLDIETASFVNLHLLLLVRRVVLEPIRQHHTKPITMHLFLVRHMAGEEIGLVVKDFLVVKLLNNQFPKSNNQKSWLLMLALDSGIFGDLGMLINPNSVRQSSLWLFRPAVFLFFRKKHVPGFVDVT